MFFWMTDASTTIDVLGLFYAAIIYATYIYLRIRAPNILAVSPALKVITSVLVVAFTSVNNQKATTTTVLQLSSSTAALKNSVELDKLSHVAAFRNKRIARNNTTMST